MSVYVCVFTLYVPRTRKSKTERKSIITVYAYAYNIHCEKESAGQTIVLIVMSYLILVLYLKHNSELEVFKIHWVTE